jgi:hypothetical protein
MVLATRTGDHAMTADLAELWEAAERMSGRAVDPLDPRFTCAEADAPEGSS